MPMTMAIEKASAVVGAEVKGLDLSVSASAETVNVLGKALAEHGVLFFRDQHLTPEQHIAFSRQFGSLETHVISDALLEGVIRESRPIAINGYDQTLETPSRRPFR